MIKSYLPAEGGYYMPAEYDRHSATILIWPTRPGSWPHNALEAQKTLTEMATELCKHETVCMLTNKNEFEYVTKLFSDCENITVLNIESNDSWARDTAPTFIKNSDGDVCGVNWSFNAWGGEYDGLYTDFDEDNKLAKRLCDALGYDIFDAEPFVLEGGSIHSDGEGTLMVTEACLLSKGRNPSMTKSEIEKKLCDYLGVRKVIWLPRGIYNDETNEHVDNVCAFIAPAEVVLAWTDNKDDPQYELSLACLRALENTTDAKGRKIKVHKLPIPDNPVCINEYELSGFVFEPGEDTREAGERLAASYVNFYFANDIILFPQFGGDNLQSDKRALDIITLLCPDRKVIPVQARSLIVGGGNIHCVTQQIVD